MTREKKMHSELKKLIEDAVKAQQASCGCSFPIPEIELEHPANPNFGDFSTNIAMKIGRQQGENPFKIAENLVKRLQERKEVLQNFDVSHTPGEKIPPHPVSENMKRQKFAILEKVEAVKPGFINFYLKSSFWGGQIGEILSKGRKYADLDLGKSRKVQVEFISANPTGPLHLGNARGGFYGDVLANVFQKAGFKAEREYYVNDGGVQVLGLGKSILAEAGILPEEEKIYGGDYIKEWVAGNKEFISENKSDVKKVGFKSAHDIMKIHIKPSILKMRIKFDEYFSEKTLFDGGEAMKFVEEFKGKNLAYEKDDALWLKTSEFGDDEDRVIVKSDGELTYLTPDIAYHYNKFAVRKFDKVVDVFGTDHHGHAKKLKAAVRALGFEERFDIRLLQLVRLIRKGKEVRMSKRAGVTVTFDELVELIGTGDASDVARFFFLSRDLDTHMDFDLELAKDVSEKNPVCYVKYAYARINGILRNTKVDCSKPNLDLIKEPAEIDLVKKLVELPEIIEQVINDKKYPVHKFVYYISEIAEKFHKFYHDCRVISDDKELTAARLALVSATKTVLEITGEDILGLEMPERM